MLYTPTTHTLLASARRGHPTSALLRYSLTHCADRISTSGPVPDTVLAPHGRSGSTGCSMAAVQTPALTSHLGARDTGEAPHFTPLPFLCARRVYNYMEFVERPALWPFMSGSLVLAVHYRSGYSPLGAATAPQGRVMTSVRLSVCQSSLTTQADLQRRPQRSSVDDLSFNFHSTPDAIFHTTIRTCATHQEPVTDGSIQELFSSSTLVISLGESLKGGVKRYEEEQVARVGGREDGGHEGCAPGFQVKHYQVEFSGAFQKGQALIQDRGRGQERILVLFIVVHN
ncbi:hypothetical protein EYF80_021519 [Liparis tanakae]|uniref:Uncharacterized protein n=1 Tax=Liparis tanakae TaxID=230148 RepID=A0A4Z2HR56_9TELE|nr:hypothetical protein EYF80_021519 [Liparis tanakae]